jgi:drug/metabolite transporter (DMT)-like permease
MLLSVFLLSGMGAFAKFLSETLNPIEIAFYRNLFVFIAFILFLAITNNWQKVKTQRRNTHIIRAAIGTLGLICGFYSISLLPLATAATLYYASPLLVVILSGPMLREHIGLPRYLAVVFGFAGIILVVKPESQDLVMIGLIFAFFDAFFSALVQIYLRDLGKTENSFTTVFYYMGIGALMTGIMLPFVWSGVPPLELYGLLIGLAVTGGLQQVTKTMGSSLAPTFITSPLSYTGIIWSTLLGFIFWQTLPGWLFFIGASMIVASNIFILWRSKKKETHVKA